MKSWYSSILKAKRLILDTCVYVSSFITINLMNECFFNQVDS